MTDEILELKLNLQLFANPEDEGRTEAPSEKKLREAREEGKVAKTPELSAALTLLVGFIILSFLGDNILKDLLNFSRRIFENVGNPDTLLNFKSEIGLKFVYQAFKILLPILIGAFIFAFIADVIQVGFQFSTKPLQPKFSKISFTFDKMMNRVFFSRQVFVNLLKSVLKISVIIVVSIIIIKADYNNILKTMNLSVFNAIGIVSWTAFKIILWVSIILIVFSLFDFMYQRWEHYQSLKMSIHEVKEERKQYEGDPQIKARQKERHREFATRRMMQEVPKADVVVTNPTHFAVALLYDKDRMEAAEVVAKGADLIAKRIKDIAKENDVPIVENRYLARALYNEVEIGDEIPAHLWEAVARVLVYVYKMREEKEAI